MAKKKKTQKKKSTPKPKPSGEQGAGAKALGDSEPKMATASDATPKSKDKTKGSSSPGLLERIRRIPTFLRDVRGEMKRVTWPGRKQLLASTSAVLVAIVVLGLYIGLLDWGFRSIAGALNL